MGCPAPVSPVVRTTDGLATSDGRNLICYHGSHVDAGAAAVVEIREGSVSGTILNTHRLGAAGEDGEGISAQGVAVALGIWVEVVSGTPTVTVYGH